MKINTHNLTIFYDFYDEEQEKRLVILMHILFILDLFSCFLDMSILNYVYNLFLSCKCQFCLVEALVMPFLQHILPSLNFF